MKPTLRIFALACGVFPAGLFAPHGTAETSPQPTTTAAVTTATTTTAQSTDPVTQLDTLVVTAQADLPPPENWLTTTLPGLTIYSSASERASKKLIQDFDMFRAALERAWPIKPATARRTPPPPLTLIFCGRRHFDDFIPERAREDSSGNSGRASITLIGPERAFIAIDMSASTITLNNMDFDIDTSFGGSALFEVDYHEQLRREYVHYLLSRTGAPPPAWYEEGALQIIQKMDVFPKYFRIGELKSVQSGGWQKITPDRMPKFTSGDPDEGGDTESQDDTGLPGMEIIPDTDFNVALQRRALLNFKDFFGVTRDSPQALNPIGNNIWAKQCYAFMHICLYALPNRYKKSLETFVERSAKEPVTEELFAACFGKTYNKFMTELRGYIDFTAYEYTEFSATGKDRLEPLPFELTPAKEGAAAAMKADALILAGNPAAALPALRGAHARGERSPDFLAAYGLAAHAAGQPELARRLLSQAIAAKTTRAPAYPAYAALLLDDAKARPAARDRVHITAAQTATVLDILFAGRELRPAQPQTYRVLADAWHACEVAPTPKNFAIIAEGLVQFPNDIELVWQAARVTLKMSDPRAAAALIDHGLKISPDAPTRARFEALKPDLAKIPAG